MDAREGEAMRASGWFAVLSRYIGVAERPALVVTIGPPGCGKSTAAARRCAVNPTSWVRLPRDGLREATGISGDRDANGQTLEYLITVGQLGAIRAWLSAGVNVIADDTCQSQETLDGWVRLARRCGARLVVWDFRLVPPEVCVERDRARGAAGGRTVGAEVIDLVAARCAEVRIPAGVEVVPASDLQLAA
jgi:predicted kinase